MARIDYLRNKKYNIDVSDLSWLIEHRSRQITPTVEVMRCKKFC